MTYVTYVRILMFNLFTYLTFFDDRCIYFFSFRLERLGLPDDLLIFKEFNFVKVNRHPYITSRFHVT